MINIKRFSSQPAIIIYLLIIIASLFLIKYIGKDNIYINYFSILINVISIFSFLITINQLITWKEVEDEKQEAIRQEITKYIKTIIVQDFIAKSHAVDSVIKHANDNNWTECLKELTVVLKLIDELEIINSTHNLGLKEDQLKFIRLATNVNCQYIEDNIKHKSNKIKSTDINKNMRTLSSLIYTNTLKIKSQL